VAAGKRVTQFERASDGSMTLFEHLRELRGRLFKGSMGVLVGTIVGIVVATRVIDFINKPYCNYQQIHAPDPTHAACTFTTTGPMDAFLLTLKVGLYVGLILGAPVWLYQLWAFIAPGLHKRERRYTYIFVAIAAPLFFSGVLLAHLIVGKSLKFFLGSGHFVVVVTLDGYFGFVTNMMLLFGAAFEFPLLIVMLNFVGMVSGRRLLGWWRPAIFLMFLFGAVVTPTPDPFGMSILAGCMATLYFAAVGVALINDRRRRRNNPYWGLTDEQIAQMDIGRAAPLDSVEPVEAAVAVAAPEPVAAPSPAVSRFDDFT
jgi:sec-independent protein translocase protein TatC